MDKLDKWDCQLIHYFKQEDYTLRGLCEIWNRRCDIYPGSKESRIVFYIVQRLAKIVEDFKLVKLSDLLICRSPSRAWVYNGPIAGMSPDELYWRDWLQVFASILINTEIARLPGYPEWLALTECNSV